MAKWVKFVNDMITRIWHGRTKKADADRYLSFLQEKGVQDYLNTPGNTGVRIWRTIEQDMAHFWTVSTWESSESIAAFAGEDISKAKYYPEDQDFLLEFEPTVAHMETFVVK
jgi:heme-degrading monooxygenase HmoA